MILRVHINHLDNLQNALNVKLCNIDIDLFSKNSLVVCICFKWGIHFGV